MKSSYEKESYFLGYMPYVTNFCFILLIKNKVSMMCNLGTQLAK